MTVDVFIVMLGKVTWLMHVCIIVECYMVRLMIKNIHQKIVCYNEIELGAPNKDVICRFSN